MSRKKTQNLWERRRISRKKIEDSDSSSCEEDTCGKWEENYLKERIQN